MKIKEGGGMDIQKEEGDFNAWFNKQTINAVPDADLSLQRLWASLAWQAQAAKAQAAPEKTVKLHLVWNENRDECVGFLDSKDARYAATGDDRGMFGVTALGDYFRDLNDERDEFETQIVMIEAQEPANE